MTDTDLQYRLALAAHGPDRVAASARARAGRTAGLLAAVAGAVWLFDLAQVIAH
jgi:hypothetical protein